MNIHLTLSDVPRFLSAVVLLRLPTSGHIRGNLGSLLKEATLLPVMPPQLRRCHPSNYRLRPNHGGPAMSLAP